MADWDVIAKQRLTEDWATLRAGYLPLNQAMRRTVEFLEKGTGSFADLLVVVRERLDGTLKNLTGLCNRRSPWVRLEAIRNLRVLATGLRGAANDDPRALLRYLFALSELLSNVWKDAPTEARAAENLVIQGEPEFWFGCDCCAVGVLKPAGPDDPPDLLRGKEVRLVWEVDSLFAHDFLVSRERIASFGARPVDLESLAEQIPGQLRKEDPNCTVKSCRKVTQGKIGNALETLVETRRGPFRITVLERRYPGRRYNYEIKFTVMS